ncbi:MAG: efflux RND transporter permease subunit [Spirochaetota bacterium]
MILSKFSIRHPAIVTILAIAVALFGLLSLSTLQREFLPDVSLPSVMIVTQYPGVEAELIEQDVTSVLEDAVITLQGLQEIKSQSMNSASTITLEFSETIDAYEVLPEVRAAIARVRDELPDGISGEPYAFVGGAGMLSIFSFSVISDRDPDRVFQFVVDEIVPSLSRIEGTAEVSAYGGREKEVRIKLDLEALESLGIAVLDVYSVLSASNISLPAGEALYRSGTIFMQVEGEYTDLAELRNLIIDYKGESFIKLQDVAEVTLDYKPPEIYIDVGDQSAVVVDVTKRSDGDTIYITESIRSLLEQYSQQYGEVFTFEIIQDDSEVISSSLGTTVRAGLLGAAMAVLIIMLFLWNIRATLIIGLSIPMSIVFAFIGMRFSGQTVNILSLSGLIVALGMVVDSSIVVLENIFTNERKGLSPREAADHGSDEVGKAVFASGSTTIAVFLPLLFLTGIIGIIMKDISLTIIFALAAALIVSLAIVPFLATRMQFPSMTNGQRAPHLRNKRRLPNLMGGMEAYYTNMLRWALGHRLTVLLSAGGILLISIFIIGILGVVFLPSADTGDFYVYLTYPQGTTLEQTRTKTLRVQELINQEVPELEQAVFFSGFSDEYSRSLPKNNSAYGKIILTEPSQRERRVQEIIPRVQQSISQNIPDVDVTAENGGFDKLLAIAAGGSGFRVELSGNDLDDLHAAADAVKNRLMQDPQIYKAAVDLKQDQETLITDLALDHMGRLGISSQEAATTGRILFNGMQVGSYSGNGESTYPIVLTSELADTPVTLRKLEHISIPSQNGTPISFVNFSSRRIDQAISIVSRKDRMRTISVIGYSTQEDTSEIRERTEAYLGGDNLPPGIRWDIAGTSSLLANSMSKLLLVLLISMFLVYMVMVIQFERFLQPVLIMASIPFCIIGVVFGLLVFGSVLSLIAFLGIIALGGVVVNNAIVLIDTMNNSEEETLERRVLYGAVSRLRPILMTTLTTFFGVLPMAVSTGGGSEVYAPLGQAIAGGLITSTAITLILIPVLYVVAEHGNGSTLVVQEGRDDSAQQ